MYPLNVPPSSAHVLRRLHHGPVTVVPYTTDSTTTIPDASYDVNSAIAYNNTNTQPTTTTNAIPPSTMTTTSTLSSSWTQLNIRLCKIGASPLRPVLVKDDGTVAFAPKGVAALHASITHVLDVYDNQCAVQQEQEEYVHVLETRLKDDAMRRRKLADQLRGEVARLEHEVHVAVAQVHDVTCIYAMCT
jgi:hypothetical protein